MIKSTSGIEPGSSRTSEGCYFSPKPPPLFYSSRTQIFIPGSQEGRERGRVPEVLEVEGGEASERNGTG